MRFSTMTVSELEKLKKVLESYREDLKDIVSNLTDDIAELKLIIREKS